ncbi:hypothetical protein JHN52_29075 [Streptomyces sp. MBT97]|uniref:hypothetical protein n=1 Tax=Streptomyces sp. MBT97 TaxID=2800411 RepID=UPI00190CAD94|nr:hypothetical protein [Streptomyces sp. MBT97]MBK3636884.1 hypothetical protein [Streptomyces sp. MBT97]
MGYLERNEGRFFRAGSYDAIELAGMIATEALTLGAGKVQIQSDGEWLTVAADQDWLEGHEHEVFHAIVPFPQAGPNSMLAEILAFAFSAGVTTATQSEFKVIKGDATAPTHPVDRDIARTVSFKRQRGSRLAE